MTKNYEVRFATPEDCEELSKIIAGVIRDLPYYNDLAKQNEVAKFQPHNLQDKISEDKLSIINLVINESIAGFCLSRFDDYTVWLEWFGIVEQYRGEGLSYLLLNELDKTVLLRNCHKIWCDSRTANKTSVHILGAHGYKQIVTIPDHWYGQDFILWQKFI